MVCLCGQISTAWARVRQMERMCHQQALLSTLRALRWDLAANLRRLRQYWLERVIRIAAVVRATMWQSMAGPVRHGAWVAGECQKSDLNIDYIQRVNTIQRSVNTSRREPAQAKQQLGPPTGIRRGSSCRLIILLQHSKKAFARDRENEMTQTCAHAAASMRFNFRRRRPNH